MSETTETSETKSTETSEFVIGAQVACSDGDCGELKRVIVDPVARALTHLVVETKHRPGTGHLVPIDLVAPTDEGIQLRCNHAEFLLLEDADETQFLSGDRPYGPYGPGQWNAWPYYSMGGMGGMGMSGMGGMGMGMGSRAFTYDKVPLGEVEVRRGEHVQASNGAIGRVQGLVIDPADQHVTHFLLDEGHLWGQKRVAIPISAVTGIDDGVQLNLTKDEVRDLPPIEVDEHD